MEEISVIAIDIAKGTLQLEGFSEVRKSVFQKKLSRSEVVKFFSNRKSCAVVMEACGGSHYWCRELEKLGHKPHLVSGEFVKSFVKGHKNDKRDAAAIGEAYFSHRVRFVGINSIEQQDLQMQLRIRDRLIRGQTAVVNELHGFLLEYGMVIPKSVKNMSANVEEALVAAKDRMTEKSRKLFRDLLEELKGLGEQISKVTEELKEVSKTHSVAQRLMTIPGIKHITALALIAAVGDPSVFKNGRHFAAWCGLVPKQNSTAGKTKLGRITKRGDGYLRSLLVQGSSACIAALRFSKNGTQLSARKKWLKDLKHRKGHQKTVVALANKNARVAWAIMSKAEVIYSPSFKHTMH